MSLEDIRSEVSFIRFPVKFHNSTNVTACIVWVSYNGNLEVIGTLKPRQSGILFVYVKHKFFIMEKGTGFLLWANGQIVFATEEYYEPGVPAFRKTIIIQNAIVDLKTLCLQQTLKLLGQNTNIDSLEIPYTLKEDLHKMSYIMDQFRLRYS